MKAHTAIIEKLKLIAALASSSEDTWASFSAEGNYDAQVFGRVKLLHEELVQFDADNILQISFDNDKVTAADFHLYEHNQTFRKWKVGFNKYALLQKKKNNQGNFNFFLSSKACQAWFEKIDPIDEENPVHAFAPLQIIVPELPKAIGNNQFGFLPLSVNPAFNSLAKFPSGEKVKEIIHFITKYNVYLSPASFELQENVATDPLFKIYLSHACHVLACCLVNEFYDYEKVIIDGLRRVPLKVYEVTDQYDFELYQLLTEVVTWVYEDRATTRRKLFNDRITLDIDDSASLIANLRSFAAAALQQAKERYNFVIAERKDAYVKELKDLLKDLRGQSDLYAQKIRTLLSNFLRDVLASVVLIGFTIFTKFTDNLNLDKHKLLVYVFWTLGGYFLVSIIMQTVVDVVDISVTSKELKYWKRASNELLPEKEFQTYYKESLSSRRLSLKIIYPVIVILYLLIAYTCFKYPDIFEHLIK